MGSGKSALGALLAEELAFGFVDLDERIVAAEGSSIPEIFEAQGEGHFRRLERRQLRETGRLEDHVIAVGGGALIPWWTMRWARRNGVVVFIDTPVDELVRRLLDSGDDRPLMAGALASVNPELAVKERVVKMISKRRRAYERADVVFIPSCESASHDARELASLLRPRTSPSVDPDRRG
ncbi:MAG: shikimate kinase [Rhodothermales bacterium]|nr:shikimate kinase [Rhodothermales bacterium]